MSDETIRDLERKIVEGDDSGTTHYLLTRARVRAGVCPLHVHRFLGSACLSCKRPDPRTKPGARTRNPQERFGARRFCERDERKDRKCFEVFDRVTGEACGPCIFYLYQAKRVARSWNQRGPS